MSIRSTLLRTTLRSSPSRFYATASTSPLATSRHITNAREAGTNSYVRAGILTVGLLAISGLLFRAGERSSERKHPLAGTPPASTEAIAETEKRINESKNPPELPKSSSDETTIHGKLNSVVENVSSKISNSEILPTKLDSSKEKEFVSKADGSPGNGGEGEEPQAAYNPITGEINWDCPCLGGMADGPCGEEFKLAFSCFVYSEEEPKGVDCVERFRGMQECFRRHPDVYGNEIEEEEEDGDLEERAIAYLAKPDSEFFLPDPVESK